MNAWRETFRLDAGALPILLGRLTIVLLSGVPVGFQIESQLRNSLGYGTDPRLQSTPLPFFVLTEAFGEVGTLGVTLTATSVALALVLDQLLASAAVARLVDGPKAPNNLLGDMATGGMVHLLPLLRLALAAGLVAGLGAAGLSALFDALVLRSVAAGDTAWHAYVVLNIGRGAAVGSWLLLVATTTFWARTMMLVDRRRRVSRLAVLLPRALWRGRSGLLFVAATILVIQLVGGILLIATRPGFSGLLSMGLWWLWLLASIYLWFCALRFSVRIYLDPRFDDLRRGSDAPWPSLRSGAQRLRRWLSKRRRQPSP